MFKWLGEKLDHIRPGVLLLNLALPVVGEGLAVSGMAAKGRKEQE